MDILLVHGYNVTSTKTYGVLPRRLKAAGHRIKNVYLSKYVTLDDDITLADIVRAFQAALVDEYGASLEKTEFAVITHSTGGLVVRDWINTYYASRMSAMPITHLIMLAPPSHGSGLATLGKSRLSRLRSLIGIEPGLRILDALELGSQYQWDLDTAWMTKELHRGPKFFPVVITGQWIDHKLWDVIVPSTYERGSDGVVRASSANVNFNRYTISVDGRASVQSVEGIPYLITPKTSHSDTRYGVMGSVPLKGDHPVYTAIEETLAVADRRAYNALAAQWQERTDQLQRQDQHYDGSKLDRYSQVVFRITDQTGVEITDYAIELIDAQGRGDRLPSGFFANQHKNAADCEFFTYYLNFDRLAAVHDGRLGFRIHTAPNTPLVAYPMVQYVTDVTKVLRPNLTTQVHVVLRRRLNKNVFRLTTNLAEQPIKGSAGPDWID